MKHSLPMLLLILALLACNTVSAPVSPVPTAGEDAAAPTAVEAAPTASAEEAQPPVVSVAEPAFGILARVHLEALEEIGPRVSGSKEERQAEQYIVSAFEAMGYSPQVQKFSAWDENDDEFQSANVIAVKMGDSHQEIIIGAHYDSGDEGQGVDDNASGVAVMLEVAELAADMDTPYTLRFIAFGSEENDLDGSYFHVARMKAADVENTIAMVNLDSLAAGDITYVYSDEGDQSFLRDWVLNWAGENDVPLQTIRNVDLTVDGEPWADYGPFQARGLAFAYFEATNWNAGAKDGWTQVDPQYGENGLIWHTQYDTLEYLEETFPGRIDERLNIFVSALYAICTEFTFE